MVKSKSDPAKSTLKRLQRKSQRNKNELESFISSNIKGLPSGWTRSTFIVREDHLKKLKTLAFWGETTLKDVLDKILEAFLANKNIKTFKKKNLSQFLKLKEKDRTDSTPGSSD